jgi:hypothetical protein
MLGVVLLTVILSGCLGSGSATRSYTISGKIVDENGQGIAGVMLELKGSTLSSVSTDSRGEWNAAVTGGVIITPIKDDYGFYPKSRKVTKETDNINFTGTEGKIVGRVSIDGKAFPARQVGDPKGYRQNTDGPIFRVGHEKRGT